MVITIIILSICLLILAVFIVFDKIIDFNIWQKRIHIGRWPNLEDWHEAILIRSTKWLSKPPVVSKSDNNRLVLLDIIKRNYSSPTIQSWQIAGLLLGTKSTISNIPKSNNIDIASTAFAILTNTSDPTTLKAKMECIYNLILDTKGDNETIPYRKGMNNIRFVDTVGLVCPFLVKYGITYNCNEAVELAEKQIREYSSFIHPTTQTPPHAYNLKYKVPLGVYDWGRGIGWYILGLVECYRLLDCTPFKDFLSQEIILLSNAMLKYQLASGGFSSSIFEECAYGEGSATTLFGLLFIGCYNIT